MSNDSDYDWFTSQSGPVTTLLPSFVFFFLKISKVKLQILNIFIKISLFFQPHIAIDNCFNWQKAYYFWYIFCRFTCRFSDRGDITCPILHQWKHQLQASFSKFNRRKRLKTQFGDYDWSPSPTTFITKLNHSSSSSSSPKLHPSLLLSSLLQLWPWEPSSDSTSSVFYSDKIFLFY